MINDLTRYKLPLILAVSGHRDLCDEDIAPLKNQVKTLLEGLNKALPNTPLCLLSALADGADRLVVEVALDLRDSDIPDLIIQCPLPLPRELYEQDFSEESRKAFGELCARIGEDNVFELEPYQYWREQPAHVDDATLSALSLPEEAQRANQADGGYGPERNAQYAQLGAYLSRHAHIVLALWDGVFLNKPGGTGEVVNAMLNNGMFWGKGIQPRSGLHTRSLVGGGELGAVLHLPVRRKSAPEQKPVVMEDQRPPIRMASPWRRFIPLKKCKLPFEGIHYYYTKAPDRCMSGSENEVKELSEAQRHELGVLFDGLESFNRDVGKPKLFNAIAQQTFDSEEGETRVLEKRAGTALNIYRAADGMAQFLQDRLFRWYGVQFLAVLLLGIGFGLISNWPVQAGQLLAESIGVLLFGVGGLVFMVTSAVLFILRLPQRFYDTRALAEIARIALYARYGGFMRSLGDRSPEARSHLAWLEGAWQWLAAGAWKIEPAQDDRTLCDEVKEWWLHNQLKYFEKKTDPDKFKKLRHAKRMGRAARWLLIIGMLLVVATFFAFWLHGPDVSFLAGASGLVLLIAGLLKQWLELKAYAEDDERYTLSRTVFRRGFLEAKASLTSDEPAALERTRQVFGNVAQYALDENFRWHRTHYERSLSVET